MPTPRLLLSILFVSTIPLMGVQCRSASIGPPAPSAAPLVPPLDSALAAPAPAPLYTPDPARMADRAIAAYGVCMAKHGGTVGAYGAVAREVNLKLGAAR